MGMDCMDVQGRSEEEKAPEGSTEKQEPALMSVTELGKILGLKKTERYWLLHKGYFESRVYLGQLWIIRDSFEKWYAGQVKYHKVNGEEPGEELKKRSYSVRDIAQMLDLHEATVYELLKREHLDTIEVDKWLRVPKEAFDTWYQSQKRYRTREDREKDVEAEKNCITMPEMAGLLGITRQQVYAILKDINYRHYFDVIEIAGRRRITWDSFNAFLDGQEKYYLQSGSDTGKLATYRGRKRMAEEESLTKNIGNEEYLTIDEACVMAGTSKTTLSKKWLRKGCFHVVKTRGIVRILRREFEAWLEEQKKAQG